MKGDTLIGIYCIHSVTQDSKVLIGKAALHMKMKKTQRSNMRESRKLLLSASNMIHELSISSMKYLLF